ncbi:hypothetical protein ACFY9Q_01320 [Streptomyces sp. NPDC012389]|uniref:hypothetical protein n=1 Tax=Streptomyces sp. NPDC012389 TaxID=3364830 RepID=UPI0036EFC958
MRVRAVDLAGEAAVASYDSAHRYELGIDFSRPPDEIADALTGIFQEAVDTGRWNRAGTGAHEIARHANEEAAPHPRDDLS